MLQKIHVKRLWLNSSEQGKKLYVERGFIKKENEMELFFITINPDLYHEHKIKLRDKKSMKIKIGTRKKQTCSGSD